MFFRNLYNLSCLLSKKIEESFINIIVFTYEKNNDSPSLTKSDSFRLGDSKTLLSSWRIKMNKVYFRDRVFIWQLLW